MDRIDRLRIFLRVAEGGSFTRAADQLGLPRATVSTAVQQLEYGLGARLLHRTTRRVSLTPDGEAVLERARAVVEAMTELELQCRPGEHALRGRLRVDMPSRIAVRVVAPALPAFIARHPAIEVELLSADRHADLVREGIDCALRVGPLSSSSLVARPLGSLRQIHCASPAYLVRHGRPQTPEALEGHVAVQYQISSSTRAAPWEWREDGVLMSRQLPANVAANDAGTYIACAEAGLGLIQIPAFDVAGQLAEGTLVEVLADWPPPALPVHLLFPHRGGSRRLHAFSQWLQQQVGPLLIERPGLPV